MENTDPLFKQLLENNSYVKELQNENKRLKKKKNSWKNKYNAIMNILHDYPNIITRQHNVIDLTDDEDSVDLRASIIDFTNGLHIIKSENDTDIAINSGSPASTQLNNELFEANIVVKQEYDDNDDECGCCGTKLDDEWAKQYKTPKQQPINTLNDNDTAEDEDKYAFECDDCNYKGRDCYQELGLTKEESTIYMDLGEPDRCEGCFDKWKNTADGANYLRETQDDQEYQEVEEEEVEEEEVEEEEVEEEEVEVEQDEEGEEDEEEEEEVEQDEEEEVEVEQDEEEEEEVEQDDEEEEEVEDDDEEEEVEDDDEEEEVEQDEDEEEEVFEINIDGTVYYTNDEKSGGVWEVIDDEDIGEQVGKFENGNLVLF